MIRPAALAALGGAVFAAAAARADPGERQFDFRLAASLLWFEDSATTSLYGSHSAAGLLPLEIGIGWRVTEHIAIGAIGRAGILHAGAGIELTAAPAGWSQEGVVFRVAPMLVSDRLLTCALFGDPLPGDRYCSTATYIMGELGAQYRWTLRGGRGISLGVAFNAGALKLEGRWGSTTARAGGILMPRVQVEF